MSPRTARLEVGPETSDEDSGDSQASGASSFSVDDLPDLTDRIRDLGLHDQYTQYRDGYMQWRQGKSAGARDGVLARRPSQVLQNQMLQAFYQFYPSYSVWNWRRTISYWIAVTFLEGSLIFTISSFLGNMELGIHRRPMVTWTYVFGAIHYSVCTYLMCIETININKKKFTFWPFGWRRAIQRLSYVQVSAYPYVASVTYFIGASVYAIPVFFDLLQLEVSENVELVVVSIPYIVAGFFFMVGGLAECLDNEVFVSKPTSHAWFGALLNFAGGLLFFVAGCCMFSSWWINCLFGCGSAIYALGAFIMVVMWKDEQFGLTFLSALNKLEKVKRGSSPSEQNVQDDNADHFSPRGVLFLIVYMCIGVVCSYNFNLCLNEAVLNPSFHLIKDVFFEAFTWLVMHLLIALLSAVVRTPKMEPYHSLFILTRLGSIPLGMISCLSFWEGVKGKFV
mmetsp:Transcript_9408/g.21392  ORF Transcript_9408/g.21392 Transcript_9408/m.21392 type:complete len:451 (-) Transcript_9408:95-1447(-)